MNFPPSYHIFHLYSDRVRRARKLTKFCRAAMNNLFFFMFVYVDLILSTAQAIVKLPNNVTIPGVFMFGDSIVDTGNNNNLTTLVKSNFPPYGRDFMGGLPTGRFGNGKVPSDLIGNSFIIYSVTTNTRMQILFHLVMSPKNVLILLFCFLQWRTLESKNYCPRILIHVFKPRTCLLV